MGPIFPLEVELFTSLAILIALLTDQFSKFIIQSNFEYSQRIDLVGEFLGLRYVNNNGVGFGLFSGLNPITISIIISVILFVLISLAIKHRKQIDGPIQFFIGMIIGGALGNLVDRIRFGYVVDFIELFKFPAIFNFSDSFIVIGVILLILTILIKGKKSASSTVSE